MRKNTARDFFRRTEIQADGCVLWGGAKNPGGYGVMAWRGPLKPTHRISWEIFNGPIPQGMLVLHRCDVPACVNIAHLFLGTPKDNMVDMVNKGRAKNERDRDASTGRFH